MGINILETTLLRVVSYYKKCLRETITKKEEINVALHLCLKDDCTGIVSDDNPLSTKHTNQGEPQSLKCYLFNDGMRTGVENDTSGMELIYTNINIIVEGYAHTLQTALAPSTSATTVVLDSSDGWGIGTIVKSGLERMRIEEIVSGTTVRVTRNYTADGGMSTIATHTIGTTITPENTNVSLAPVSVDDVSIAGVYLNGGETLTTFLAPTYLQSAITSAESATSVTVSNGSLYSKKSIIQIDNEQMRVDEVNGNTLTVTRGYNNTLRAGHQSRSVVYLVGLTESYKAYPFFIKNDPPAGLPTQKKYDIRIKISTDEEPL